MARGIHRLSAAEVRTKTKPGYYADGGGLYLQVSKWQTRLRIPTHPITCSDDI